MASADGSGIGGAAVNGREIATETIDEEQIAVRLNEFLADCGQEALETRRAGRFAEYLVLLLRWNARTNLTAIRDIDGILSRHFVESVVCARALPAGIARLLDFGSGAGFLGRRSW